MKEESLVKPKPIKNFKKENIIFIPYDTENSPIKNLFKNKIIKKAFLFQSEIYMLKDKIILYKAMSAPLGVMCLEKLIASGAKEIIIIGFCGSLNKRVPIGSAVLIKEAYSEEGTSLHYFKKRKKFSPSPITMDKIRTKLESAGLSYFNGTCVSTDAPFRETYNWICKMKKRKIDFVDMETSAVYALAEYHEIDAGALMIVSDIFIEDKWIYDFSNITNKIKEYFSIFL